MASDSTPKTTPQLRPSNPKTLPISSLRRCPVRVNLHTEYVIEAIRSSLEEGRSAPGITIALVGKSFYIVDGHARVEAYQRAEMEEVNIAEVLNIGSETDLLIEHVRRNLHSPMNPIRLAAIAARLAKTGVREPFKALGISPVMETAVNVANRWPVDVLTKLSRVLDINASKFSDVYALPHFFVAFEELTEKVRRGDKNAEDLLRNIISYIVQYLESVSEESEFTLPGPDQIHALMTMRRQRIVEETSSAGSYTKRAKSRLEEEQDPDDGDWEEGSKGKGDDNDSGVSYKAPLLMPDRNKSVIQCTHCGKPQVVDLKTGHVCPVESVADGMIEVIRDGDGRRAYVLGAKAMKFLGLDRPAEEISPSKYRVIATDKKSDVERLLRSTRPAARLVLIISDSDQDLGGQYNGRSKDAK